MDVLKHLPAASISLHRPATYVRDFRAVRSDLDVWMDLQWAPDLSAFAPLPRSRYKVLRFSHDVPTAKAPDTSSPILDSLELPLPMNSCGRNGALPLSIASAVRAMGGVDGVWRRAFEFVGLHPSSIDRLLTIVSEENARTAHTVCSTHRARSNLEWLNGEGDFS